MNLIPWRNKQRQSSGNGRELTPIDHFRREMDRMFDRFLAGWDADLNWDGPYGLGQMWHSGIEMDEDDEHVIVRAEVPGFDPKEINVSVTGQMLTITAEHDERGEKKGSSYSRRGSLRQSVQLPSYVDTTDPSAEYHNGVLTVRIRKDEKSRPRKVDVKLLEK